MKALFRFLFGGLDTESGSGSDDKRSPSLSAYRPQEKLTFEETVSHLARGYENTQRVIQFMDAKAGAVVALCLAIYAFVGKMVGWAFEAGALAAFQALPCWAMCSLAVVAFAIILCGFCSLTFAFKTVKPNPLPGWQAFAVLFPAHRKKHESKARELLDPFLMGADQGLVVKEFQEQLIAVGQLIHRKIFWLQLSVWLLWSQGLASAVFGGAILWAVSSGQLVNV